MKREALDHTKTKRLCRRLNIPLYQAVGILETLWHITAKQAPRGDIGKLSNEDIAIGMDYRSDEGLLINALIMSGWLDENETHRLLVHDWHEHADDALQMRLARSKQYFCSGYPPKTNRLGKWEREEADKYIQSVRTEMESVRTACAYRALDVLTPCTPPSPALPRLAPPEPHHHQSPAVPHGEFPDTAAAVREGYPETGDEFIMKLTIQVGQKVAGLNGKIKGELTDALIARAIRYCARKAPQQNSAGLYLKTVPQCVASWLTNGEPAEPTANPIFNPDDYGLPKT